MVASMAGEGHAEGLARLIDELIDDARGEGHAAPGRRPYVPPPPPATALRFPGKALALADGAPARLGLRPPQRSSSWPPTARRCVRRIGTGDAGPGRRSAAAGAVLRAAGAVPAARRPSREIVGYDVVVADTVNHLLRGVRLDTGEVTTVAGTGRPWRSARSTDHRTTRSPSTSPHRGTWPGTTTGSSSRWPASTSCGGSTRSRGTAGVYAGTTVEALRDGAAAGRVAGPAVRAVRLRRRHAGCGSPTARPAPLRYVRGRGDAHRRGAGPVRLRARGRRRPSRRCCSTRSGVCALPDGSVLVADTYNGAVRRYDPATDQVSTVADRAGRAERPGAHRRWRRGGGRVCRAPADPARPGRAARSRSLTRRPGRGTAPNGRRPTWPPARSPWMSSSPRRPARSWTTRSARRPGSRSPRPRRSCC